MSAGTPQGAPGPPRLPPGRLSPTLSRSFHLYKALPHLADCRFSLDAPHLTPLLPPSVVKPPRTRRGTPRTSHRAPQRAQEHRIRPEKKRKRERLKARGSRTTCTSTIVCSPYLSPPRRVVAFDFLGWGSSDKPPGYPYTTDNQVGDLDAVITQLGLGQVVLVAHDASGPPAIDWALAHPERVAGLVLLNTYYCEMPTLRPPEAIWLFSTPVVRSVARPVSQMFGNWLFRRMYWWQVGEVHPRRGCQT